MLSSYTFTHPTTGARAGSSGLSYLWAALFGALYVVFAGAPSRIFHALAWQILCVGGFICTAIAASFVPQAMQAALLAITFLLALSLQSFGIVRIVRGAYRSRGWRVRRAD